MLISPFALFLAHHTIFVCIIYYLSLIDYAVNRDQSWQSGRSKSPNEIPIGRYLQIGCLSIFRWRSTLSKHNVRCAHKQSPLSPSTPTSRNRGSYPIPLTLPYFSQVFSIRVLAPSSVSFTIFGVNFVIANTWSAESMFTPKILRKHAKLSIARNITI